MDWFRRLLSARAALAMLVVAVSVGVAPLARGQWMGGPGEFTPDLVTKRGVLGYSKVLGLDEEQKQTALVLLDGTKTEYRKEMKVFQDKMKEMQASAMEDQDFSAFQKEMPDLVGKLQDKVASLEKQFFDDLRAICDEAQAGRWDALERYRRREKFLKFSAVSGSAADVVGIVERTGTAPEGNTEFAETLAQYELDVDKPLREFERFQDEQTKTSRDQMERWTTDPQGAMEEMNTLMERMFVIGKDLRTVNRDYARRLTPMMSEESRVKFTDEFNRRSFARVYRESHATKLVNAGLALTDLSEEQKQSLAALREQHTRDAAAANERWAKTIEEVEEKNNGTMGRMMNMMQGGEGNEEEKEARNARKELDERTEERVKAILSESQFGKMPEKKVEAHQPWEDMMPDRSEWVDEDIAEEAGK